MIRPGHMMRHGASLVALAALLAGTAAQSKTTNYLDLEAGLGYASNPALQFNSQSSLFGRISARGVHAWSSERSSTTLSAYVENSTYFKNYGSKQLFDLEGTTSYSVNPNLSVYGSLGFQGDFAGQLSNRLLPLPAQPVVVDPLNPLPLPSTTPDLFGISGRQYRLSGQVGASIRATARSTISLTAGAQRQIFTGNRDADYSSYFASAGYSQQISERTSAGATLFLQRQDFRHGDYANVVNPVATIQTSLREGLTASAAVGIMSIDQNVNGHHDHNLSPSFSGSLCSISERSQFCGRIARDAQSSLGSRLANGVGGAAISTSAGLSYNRRLGENESVQAGLSGVQYTSPSNLNGLRIRTSYLSGVVGYDRKIGNRLYAGAQGGVRKLFQDGPDPDLDLNANLYVRYRLGDLL